MQHGEEFKGRSKEFLTPPFSAYDFFGYLIPAFVFFLCVFLFEVAAKTFLPKGHTPLHGAFHYVALSKEPLLQAALAVGVIFVAYVCGHVIATISSALLDRFLIRKAHGYPSENLFMGRSLTPSEFATRSIHRGSFAWANIFAWFVILMIIFDVKGLLRWYCLLGMVFVFLPLLAVFLAADVKGAADRKGVLAMKYPRIRKIIAFGIRVYRTPYDFLWSVPEFLFGWDERFSASLTIRFTNAFESQFHQQPKDVGTDVYWFTTFYISERSPNLYQMLRNWLNLYSFARNVATAIYLAFAYALSYIAVLRYNGKTIGMAGEHCFLGILAAYFILSFILAVRFHYLYFSYYSKNLFRIFVYLKVMEDDKSGSNDDERADT